MPQPKVKISLGVIPGFRLGVWIFLAVAALAAGGLSAPSESPLESVANSWKKGDAIPQFLQAYRVSDLPGPDDTIVLMQRLHNYPLLLALIGNKDVDEEVVDCALAKGLRLVGPVRMFNDIEGNILLKSEALSTVRRQRLTDRIAAKHIWISVLGIADKNRSGKEKAQELRDIARDLRAGRTLTGLLEEHPGLVAQKVVLDGKEYGTLTRSTNGPNYGVATIGGRLPLGLLSGSAQVPEADAKRLMNGTAGQMIESDDGENEAACVYRIEEVYNGGRDLPRGANRDNR